MTAYVINDMEVTDPVLFEQYKKLSPPTVAQYGGRFLARGGRIELLLPYATLEPIRKMLLQQFMGEKFGRDNIWESHLATELWTTQVDIKAVLDVSDR